jgi:heat shock protein 1/8
VHEVAILFLNSLLASAEAFLGRKPTGLVISVPSASPNSHHHNTSSHPASLSLWTHAQYTALLAAARATSIPVLQLLESAGATTLSLSSVSPDADLTTLIVDLGQSGLPLTLLAMRAGLAHALAESHDESVSGRMIDDALLKFFAKDFTKKLKTPLIC